MIACLSTVKPTRVLRGLKQWFLTPPFTGIQTVRLSATAGRYAPVLRLLRLLLRLLRLLRLRYIHRKYVEASLFAPRQHRGVMSQSRALRRNSISHRTICSRRRYSSC